MTADRMRTPGFGRNGTERANWSLRDNILQLEEELTLTRSQLSKVTYQLQAVVALVKRAWTGDNASSIQLAKFVGVAPPDVFIQSSCDCKHFKVIPKKRSINNWAKLATGLLKTVCKRHDTEVAEDLLHYLNDRHQYLEEQVNRNEGSRKTLYRPRSSSYSDLSIQRRLPTTAKVSSVERILSLRPSLGHVFEPTSQMTSEIAHNGFFESSALTRNQESETNDITTNVHGCSGNRRPECKCLLTNNMFNVGDIISDIHLKPPSGTLGTLRSKSAAPIRGERSLKYETTRPVSAQVQKTKSRTQSAKLLKHRTINPPQSAVEEKFDMSLDVEKSLNPIEIKRTSSPVTSESDVEDVKQQREEDREMTKLKMNIKKPQSVIAFDRDLLSAAELENDFRKNAVELQKRLGVNINGMIFHR